MSDARSEAVAGLVYPGGADPNVPLPFEHLFYPLVSRASDELRRSFDVGIYKLLTPEAHAGWERYLLLRLTAAGAEAAHRQFQIFQTARTAFSTQGHERGRRSNQYYDEFVGERPEIRLQILFVQFPALEKVCCMLVANWISAVAEFLGHLALDHSKLTTHFQAENLSGSIIKLIAGLSDPHRGGRCVVRVFFERGGSLIYKPRSLAPEAHFSTLIDQINGRNIPHRLRSAHCWDRGQYGWMENIESVPCSTYAGISTFYWRSGALLGLIYLALGVDFHRENLIAAGEQPVLLDLETLWHPQEYAGNDMVPAASTVQRTGFLPQNGPAGEKIYEWGALCRVANPEFTLNAWFHVNQDDMDLLAITSSVKNASHLPNLEGVPYLAPDFVGDIQAGFSWIGKWLFENAVEREIFANWLLVLKRCPRRLVRRSTSRYRTVIERITSPRSLELQEVRADPVADFGHGRAGSEDECRALEHLDIPHLLQATYEGLRPDDFGVRTCSEQKYREQIFVIADALSS